MKHNQEKFGHKNGPAKQAEVTPEPQANKEAKPAADLKPYKPFEAKHHE